MYSTCIFNVNVSLSLLIIDSPSPYLQPKCFKYWPSQGGKAYGNIVVRVDRDIVLPFYTIRSFKLIDVSCHVLYMYINNKTLRVQIQNCFIAPTCTCTCIQGLFLFDIQYMYMCNTACFNVWYIYNVYILKWSFLNGVFTQNIKILLKYMFIHDVVTQKNERHSLLSFPENTVTCTCTCS